MVRITTNNGSNRTVQRKIWRWRICPFDRLQRQTVKYTKKAMYWKIR